MSRSSRGRGIVASPPEATIVSSDIALPQTYLDRKESQEDAKFIPEGVVGELCALAKVIYALPPSCHEMIFEGCVHMPEATDSGVPKLPSFLEAVRPCHDLYASTLRSFYQSNVFTLKEESREAFEKLSPMIVATFRRLDFHLLKTPAQKQAWVFFLKNSSNVTKLTSLTHARLFPSYEIPSAAPYSFTSTAIDAIVGGNGWVITEDSGDGEEKEFDDLWNED